MSFNFVTLSIYRWRGRGRRCVDGTPSPPPPRSGSEADQSRERERRERRGGGGRGRVSDLYVFLFFENFFTFFSNSLFLFLSPSFSIQSERGEVSASLFERVQLPPPRPHSRITCIWQYPNGGRLMAYLFLCFLLSLSLFERQLWRTVHDLDLVDCVWIISVRTSVNLHSNLKIIYFNRKER